SMVPCDLHSFPTRRSSDLFSLSLLFKTLKKKRYEVLFTTLVPMQLCPNINMPALWAGAHLSNSKKIESLILKGLMRICKKNEIRSEEHTSELQSRENLVCR